MKIGVISLGCAKNLVDTENLLGILTASNQEIVRSYEEAEALIINTCGFIESAKTEAIDTILNAADLKENNLKKLIVMGCLSTRYKPQLEEEIRDSLDGIEELVMDFSGVEYISSAGLRTLLMAKRELHNKGTVKVINANVELDANAPVYNILGQKVENVTKAGVYIQNGKKFIVK